MLRTRKRKYDPVEADRNAPYAHPAYDDELETSLFEFFSGTACWCVGGYVMFRGWRLIAHLFDAVESQLEVVSVAAVTVTMEAQRATGAFIWTCGYGASAVVLVAVIWFAYKKTRLRLTGMEPEANVVRQLWAPEAIAEVQGLCQGWGTTRETLRREHEVFLLRVAPGAPYGTEELHAGVRFVTTGGTHGQWHPVVLKLTGQVPMTRFKENTILCLCREYAHKQRVCLHLLALADHLICRMPRLPDFEACPSLVEGRKSIFDRITERERQPALPPEAPRVSTPTRSISECYQGMMANLTRLKGMNRLSSSRRDAASEPPPARPLEAQQVQFPIRPPGGSATRETSQPSGGSSGSQDPPRPVETVSPSAMFLGGSSPQRMAVNVLTARPKTDYTFVYLSAFSLDQEDLVEALSNLPCNRLALMDKSQTFGRTTRQFQLAKKLAAHGVQVRVGTGTSVRAAYAAHGRSVGVDSAKMGIVHGKSLYVRFHDGNETFLIGSCNWTCSSTCNIEFGIQLHNPGKEFARDWRSEWDRGWNSAVSLQEAETSRLRNRRVESSSPSRGRSGGGDAPSEQ